MRQIHWGHRFPEVHIHGEDLIAWLAIAVVVLINAVLMWRIATATV